MESEKLTVEVIGGAGKIGANNMLYIEDGMGLCCFVDCGADPGENDPQKRLYSKEIERAMEISRLNNQLGRNQGLLLTHAHHDHIGNVPMFFKRLLDEGLSLPLVVGSPFTIRLLKEGIEPMLRFEEEVRDSAFLSEESIKLIRFPAIEVADGGKQYFGSTTVQAIPVQHSSPGCFGYLFKSKVADGRDFITHRMFITGDYKSIPVEQYSDLQDVDFLMTDGTSVTRNYEVTENDVYAEMVKIFEGISLKNRVFAGVISTNMARTVCLLRAAYQSKRVPAIFAPSLSRNYDIVLDLDVEGVMPKSFERHNSNYKVYPSDLIITTGVWAQGFVSQEDLEKLDPEKQQEAKKTMSGIAKLATGMKVGEQFNSSGQRYGGYEIQPGDVVLISGSIYDFVYEDLKPMLKQLSQLGARIILDNTAPKEWGYERAILSAGGHGSRQSVERVIKGTNPRHLAAYYVDQERIDIIHELAARQGSDAIPVKNGDVLEISVRDGSIVKL